jgi:hypothetical protein
MLPDKFSEAQKGDIKMGKKGGSKSDMKFKYIHREEQTRET